MKQPGTAIVPVEVLTEQRAAQTPERRRKPLSALRSAARLHIEDGITVMGRIVQGTLYIPDNATGAEVMAASVAGLAIDAKDRIAAFNALTRIGVPQQIEVRTWEGDWSQFNPDELERIVAGEHPEDVLAGRADEVVIEAPEFIEVGR